MPISLAERTQVLAWLDESHTEFVTAIDGVSDAQWTWKPAPERWSVGEIAEHVVLAEALLYVPLHTIRHRRQIDEVKATPAYPATHASPLS